MTYKRTSIKAFKEITEEGLLSKMRYKVYKELYLNGPATGSELNNRLDGYSYHKRLSELRDLGVVEEICTRKCNVSNRLATVWNVIYGRLPKKKNENENA